jgi:hypothetical protein
VSSFRGAPHSSKSSLVLFQNTGFTVIGICQAICRRHQLAQFLPCFKFFLRGLVFSCKKAHGFDGEGIKLPRADLTVAFSGVLTDPFEVGWCLPDGTDRITPPSPSISATGSLKAEARAVQVSLSYGFAQGDWLVTPGLGVAHYGTRRAAYIASGAAFNASYDAMTTGCTVATLDAELVKPISRKNPP